MRGKRSKYFMHAESKKAHQERPKAAIEEARSSDSLRGSRILVNRQPLECFDEFRVWIWKSIHEENEMKRIREEIDKRKREEIDELEREVVRLEKLLLEGEAKGEELVVGVKNVYNRAEIEGRLSDKVYSLKKIKSVRRICWI